VQANTPCLVVVMGVSGCGKSTLAEVIANKMQMLLLEADDFHTAEAKSKMAAGIALDDNIRLPWVERISDKLLSLATSKEDIVLAFSGLRRVHRDKLRQLPFRCIFLWLDVEQRVLQQRLAQRQGHFFAPELLSSQFKALQIPDVQQERDVHRLAPDSFETLPQLMQASHKIICGITHV